MRSDSVDDFFGELDERGHVDLLAATTGTVRFELTDDGRTDQWWVSITRGDVAVQHAGGVAGCVIRADRAWFQRLLRGQENAVAAVLRGALDVEGDVETLFALQRIFPGPQSHASMAEGGGGR